MANSGDIRAGGAAFEITANKEGLIDALDSSEEAFKKFKADASRIAEGLMTPLEKLEREMAKIQALGAKGYLDPTQTERGIAAVKKQIEDLGKSGSGGGGFFKSLKGQLGEESDLGNFGKLLKGAGAVAGVTMVSRAIKDAADKAAELRQQYERGEISATQMAGGLARSLPVLGDMTQAFDSIRELITGENAEINKQAELIMKAAAKTDEHTRKMVEARGVLRGLQLDFQALSMTGPQLQIFNLNRQKEAADKEDIQKLRGTKELPDILKQREANANKQAYDISKSFLKETMDALKGRFAFKQMNEGDGNVVPEFRRWIGNQLNRGSELVESGKKTVAGFSTGDVAGVLGAFVNKQIGNANALMNSARERAMQDDKHFASFASGIGNFATGGDLGTTAKDILKQTETIAKNIGSGGATFA